MLFTTTKRADLRIHSHRLARPIVFEDGRYETDDPAEIRALRRNRYVREGEGWQAHLTEEPVTVDRDLGNWHEATSRQVDVDDEPGDEAEDDADRPAAD